MTDRRGTPGDEPHRRFTDWLVADSESDPPRDLAVHASVCADCQRQIAAFDLLTLADPARAGLPPLRAATAERRVGAAARVAVAVTGVAALAVISVGGYRLVLAGANGPGSGSEAPTQAVLGNTGQPEASSSVGASATHGATAAASVATPSGAAPTATPFVVVPPATSQPAVPSAQPTIAPSATARPSVILPSPTPAPTATPSPTDAPSPSPEPTPEGSLSPAA